MNVSQIVKPMIRGGAVGVLLLFAFIMAMSLFPVLDESIVGRMVWEMPVPAGIIKKINICFFGSSNDDRGLVVVFTAIGIEYAILGALVGLVIHVVRRNERRNDDKV